MYTIHKSAYHASLGGLVEHHGLLINEVPQNSGKELLELLLKPLDNDLLL